MGLCRELREDGHLTAGVCGFTSWNETVENLSDTYVNREAKCILAISEEAEAESSARDETARIAFSKSLRAPSSIPYLPVR